MRTIKTTQGLGLILLMFLLSACGQALAKPTSTSAMLPTTAAPLATATDTATPLPSDTATSIPTPTATSTQTATVTRTPSVTPSPTITHTPSITPSPTFDFPDAVVNTTAHCRYGPSKAHLHAADLYAGDKGIVIGRFPYSSWLRVRFDKLTYACWVAPSVVDVSGDITTIAYTEPDLLSIGSNMYGPPQEVSATRDGNQVTITWKRVDMTQDDDRGYFIEAWVCQNGAYLWWTVSFPDQYTTSYTVQDDSGCAQPSRGEIRTLEKHGYSEAVTIPWP